MTRRLLISGLIWLSGFVTSTNAQVYTFYFDTTASSSVSSSAGATAGRGMAEIEITIAGNQLTAIIRNTSPGTQNSDSGGSDLSSPAIVGWGVDLEAASLTSTSDSRTTSSGRLVSYVGDLPTGWRPDPGMSLSFSPDGDGLYPPEATGGLETAVFTATFSGTIQLVERTPDTFSPFVRFGYVGDGEAQFVDTSGSHTPTDNDVGAAHSPEPSSLLIWALGIALCVGVHRRWRPKTTR